LLLKENKPQIEKSIDDLSYASSSLRDMMDQNKSKLETTLNNLDHASNDFQKITSTLEELSISLKNLSQRIEKGEGTLGQLINDKSLYQDLKKTNKAIDELIQDIKNNPRRYFKFELF
jgi:phospholipid/cholesterol/gamma-HCH transport system substrate-binding protein